ncbi:unnamed protein product [Peniophora sp. CBMAI 1063]|nr:unnamed protein product [Peniophora sp. CBMAI 1063]
MSDDDLPDYLKTLPPFKYLTDPHDWGRSQAVTGLPSAGDFVVCSIDPEASVAHLDEEARLAARKLPTRRYVAFIMQSIGVCFGHEPINAFRFTFVRQGVPPATQAGQPVFQDHCIPILPNTFHPTGRKPLCPAHPLPWRDCYIDSSLDFNLLDVRVTATPRDYTVVLPCDEDQMDYMVDRMGDDLHEHFARVDGWQRGDVGAVAALALPPSPRSAFKVPLPPSPIHASVDLPDGYTNPRHVAFVPIQSSCAAEDDVSIIASDDGGSTDEAGRPTHPDDFDRDLMLLMEDMFDTSGDVNDPVVNVWYDLDMVREIPDPRLFLEERAKIREIIADAETRLGIRQAREEAAARPQAFNPFRRDEPYPVVAEDKNTVRPPAIVSAKSSITSGSGFGSKSTLITRWAAKSRDLLRKGPLSLHPFVCYTVKAHDPLD